MKSKSRGLTLVVASALALASVAFCQAQAQTQASAQTEAQVAKLNGPASTSPPGSASDSAGAATTPDVTKPAATADATKPAATASDEPVPRAALEELDALKKRIEELETELKSRGGSTEPAAPPDAAPDANTSSTPADSSDSSWSSSSTTTSAQATTAVAEGSAQGVTPATAPEKKPPVDPFSLYDYTWMNANSRNHDTPLATKYFSPEFRTDTNYILDYNHPVDHTMGGATESFRSGEVQIEQMSFGGDLRVGNVRGRVLTMFGLFSTTTPRNDASFGTGGWNLRGAYQYVSEAWGGYHFNVNHGLNVDAGIFVSYIGLFSYYNFDNWAYQPSFVSSNTPWFFNGLRVQWFPTAKLKIEPWFINGWQSYAKYNSRPGLGGQILWRPNGWLSFVFNNYGMGTDVLNNPNISRIHTDDSMEMKYYDHPNGKLDYMAFSLTGDLGCEYGGASPLVSGVSCFRDTGPQNALRPKTSFVGAMAYNRWDFAKNHYGITYGGGFLNNPGRYLTLLPPINGADAVTGSPYFTENPGDKFHGIDTTLTFDYMPDQFITFRLETGYRHSDVPYWTGHGGITPPGAFGGTNGSPADYVCSNGASSGVTSLQFGSLNQDLTNFSPNGGNTTQIGVEEACYILETGTKPTTAAQVAAAGGRSLVWFPDLRTGQWATTFAVMVKF